MFCNHCGAKNPDQAVSCLMCGKPQSPFDWSRVISNTPPRPSGGKRWIFVSVIQYLVELAITLLVLFHNYASKDTTAIDCSECIVLGLFCAWVCGSVSRTVVLPF